MKLRRVESDFFGGVCEGLGEYFNISPDIFRMAFVIWFCYDVCALMTYFVLCIFIPDQEDDEDCKKEDKKEK